jgi:hypothetical protein
MKAFHTLAVLWVIAGRWLVELWLEFLSCTAIVGAGLYAVPPLTDEPTSDGGEEESPRPAGKGEADVRHFQ